MCKTKYQIRDDIEHVGRTRYDGLPQGSVKVPYAAYAPSTIYIPSPSSLMGRTCNPTRVFNPRSRTPAVGLPAAAVIYHAAPLEQARMLGSRREGRVRRYFPTRA